MGHRAQQDRGDIVRGAWGAQGKTHIQGVAEEVQKHLEVAAQNLDPHQGVLDQEVLGGKHLDDMDSNMAADLLEKNQFT